MKNIDVIETFINGGKKGKTTNLCIEGNKLINYGTCIAERVLTNGKHYFTVNVTKYSQSTSTIQNKIKRELADRGISYSTIEKVRMGVGSL